MAETLKVRLVAPDVWQPALASVLSGVSADEQPFVRTGLAALQRQHVGITPSVMAALAPAVLRPHQRSAVSGAWGAVYDRLLDSLRSEAHQAREQVAVAASLTLSADPTYVLLRIAAPVVQAACQRLGYTCLLCADSVGTTVNPKTYRNYDLDLTDAIAALAQNKTDDADLFWRERAYTLSSLARNQQDTDTTAQLPIIDPLAAGVFLRLEPQRKAGQEETKRSRRLLQLKRQRNLRWREEGFDGIHLSHSNEDLPYRLITEYLYDRPTQLDRVLNTGFLALEREPKHIRLRDVLITAYLPAPFWRKVQADFLRACWFDFALRAALLLRQNMLLKSEFRWIEADPAGRSRTLVFRLAEMPEGATAAESAHKTYVRRQFCASLRWLPRILDTASAAFEVAPDTSSRRIPRRGLLAGPEHEYSHIDHWITTLWRLQKEERPIDSEARSDKLEPLAADDFVYTFHMPFLPVNKKPPAPGEARQQRARLAGRLQAARPYQGSLCLTWTPLEPANVGGWLIDRRTHQQDPPMVSQDQEGKEDKKEEKPEPNQLAGEIVNAWLDRFLKEAPGG